MKGAVVAHADPGASRPKRLEPPEPVHRLGRRRSFSRRRRGGARRGTSAGGRGYPRRPRFHVRVEARDPHALDRSRRNGPDVGAGRTLMASQRAPLRCAPGSRQGGDRRPARRGAGENLAPKLRHPAAGAGRRRSYPSPVRTALQAYFAARSAVRGEPERDPRACVAILARHRGTRFGAGAKRR